MTNPIFINARKRPGLEEVSQHAFNIVLGTIHCKNPERRKRRIERVNPILRSLLSGKTSLFAKDSEWIAQDLMWQILACMEDMAQDLKRKEDERRKEQALCAEQKADALQLIQELGTPLDEALERLSR